MSPKGSPYLWDKQDGLKGHLSFSCEVAVCQWFLMVLKRDDVRRAPITGGLADMLTYKDTHESMYTHARTHAHTHTRTHARMHTRMHTHTHTQKCMLSNLGEGLVKLVIFTVSDVLRTVRRVGQTHNVNASVRSDV